MTSSEFLRDEEELGLGPPLLLTDAGVSLDRNDDLLLLQRTVERAAKFIFRGLLILLGVYLFNSMREYAIRYTGGDVGFSTFAAIVVAVPIAEILGIMGQTMVAPWSRPPIRSLSSMPFTPCGGCNACADLIEEAPMPADAGRTKKAATEAALDVAAVRITICISRGLLALLWVFLVDLMRRYITHGAGELIFTISPSLILAAGVTMFFCFLMESFSGFINRHIHLWNGTRIGSS